MNSLKNNFIVAIYLFTAVFYLRGAGVSDDSLFTSEIFIKANTFSGSIEGPAVDQYGYIYAVQYSGPNTIGRVTPKGEASLFVTLPSGSRANGIRFDSNENMYIADYGNHNILKVDMNTNRVSVYAHDDRMNQPNDLAITDDDVIYASDPNWGDGSGNLWMIDTSGTTHLLLSDLTTTNGIEVSPDNKTLYVGESNNSRVLAFDILENDSVANKRVFKQFSGSNIDGMRCDSTGNLYVTCYNKHLVYILSPEGSVIKTVTMIGSNPTNIAFGGPDGKRCYVTIGGSKNIETFLTDTPGRSWVMRNDITSIEREKDSGMGIINTFKLEQNYPNPFNPVTHINFTLAQGDRVSLNVYNTAGKKVTQLVNDYLGKGSYHITFNGNGLASGIYVYVLKTNKYRLSKKMILIK